MHIKIEISKEKNLKEVNKLEKQVHEIHRKNFT